jgi:hypothetical protein
LTCALATVIEMIRQSAIRIDEILAAGDCRTQRLRRVNREAQRIAYAPRPHAPAITVGEIVCVVTAVPK